MLSFFFFLMRGRTPFSLIKMLPPLVPVWVSCAVQTQPTWKQNGYKKTRTQPAVAAKHHQRRARGKRTACHRKPKRSRAGVGSRRHVYAMALAQRRPFRAPGGAWTASRPGVCLFEQGPRPNGLKMRGDVDARSSGGFTPTPAIHHRRRRKPRLLKHRSPLS